MPTDSVSDTLQHLTLDRLIEHPKNPRGGEVFRKDHQKMAELVASIGAAGLIEPIIARHHPSLNARFQIVDGHRRFAAAKLAKLETVPVIVRNYTDEEALGVILATALQREDLSALEEAKVIQDLQESKGVSIEEIASYFGKTYSWAVRRSRLTMLTVEAIAFIEENAPHWSAHHLELIARYEPAHQLSLLENLGAWNISEMGAEDLDRHLRSKHMDIGHAPWDPADADLVAEVGACTACTKRSGCNQVLFEGLDQKAKKEQDLCLDSACWEQKATAHLGRREAALAVKHTGLLRVSESYNTKGKDAIASGDYTVVKKKEEGATPAILVDGKSPGRLIYVKLPDTGRKVRKAMAKTADGSRVAEAPNSLDQRKAELATKREGLQRRRMVLAWQALAKALDNAEPKSLDMTTFIKGDEFGAHDDVVLEEEDEFADLPEEVAETAENEEKAKGTPNEPFPVPVATAPTLAGLVAWTYIHGATFGCDGYSRSRADAMEMTRHLIAADETTLRDALWNSTTSVMARELRQAIAIRDTRSKVPMIIAHLLSIDLDDLVAKAAVVITEPKAWKVQYPEAYLGEAG